MSLATPSTSGLSYVQVMCRDGDLSGLQTAISIGISTTQLEKGLVQAIRSKQLPVIKLLLDNGAAITDSVFHEATKSRSIEVFQCFLDAGWNINSTVSGDPALRLVVGCPDLVRWMLDHGADPRVRGRDKRGELQASVMRTAVTVNSIETIKILLAHGVPLESEMFEPCFAASEEPVKLQTLEFILTSGLNPNVRICNPNIHTYKMRATPLQLAVRRNRLDQVRLLLQHGADPLVRTRGRKTLLKEAIELGDEDMIELVRSAVASQLPPMDA